jgi:hypothetical protein
MLPPLEPPPRHVPLSLRILNWFNGPALVGWVFFAFGMIFFWAFAGNADLSFITFRGAHQRAMGKVTSVETSSASVNRQHVMKNHYEFSVAGAPVRGTSYSTGSSVSEGDDVTIEYDPADPMRSRIAGMRRALFGPWLMLVAIFPAVGVLVIFFSTKYGFKRNRLLRDGVLTTGKLISKQATNTTVNDQRVYEFTFEFAARDGRRGTVVARTSQTRRLEDEKDEPLLYDPNDLARAYMLDEVPARPQIEQGQLRGRPTAALLALLLPVGAIAVHGFILWLKIIL